MSGTGRPPTGVVTLVFTDIEGSTRLLHELDERYIDVLEEHNARVRRAMSAHGGFEIKNEGDGFLFAFTDATAAVSGCAETQKTLHEGDWPHDRRTRVRMGLHRGSVTLYEDDYVGLAVHEAHRVCSAAHGGQIVVTDAVLDAAGTKVPDVSFDALGPYRLRDFPDPRRLHQASVHGLEHDFPTLRTSAAQRTVMLPAPGSAIVARERELAELDRLLRGPDRLITLTGPGGVGKTRLSIEAASGVQDHFTGGVWLVELASVLRPDDIAPTVVRTAAGRTDADDVEHLARLIGNAPALVVADNVEHLARGANAFVELLEQCPTLTILATSRELLHVAREREFALHGLDTSGSLELFTSLAPLSEHTARATEPALIEDICTHVGGLPLAIELVAAALRRQTPRDLFERLRADLDVLTDEAGDRPARHRGMRTAIEWSWDLLDADERAVLQAIAVTSGNASRDLVAAVARVGSPDEVISSLRDKSLVSLQDGRVRLLELIRSFAATRTDADLRGRLSAAHAEWCAQLVRDAGSHLLGDDTGKWLDRLEAEHDDIRVALEGPTPEPLIAELEHLATWWTARGHWVEARSALRGLLERGVEGAARAEVMALLASASVRLGLLDEARALSEEGLALPDTKDVVRARFCNALGEVDRISGHDDTAEAHYVQALALSAGDDHAVATAASNLGVLAWQTRRLPDAHRWWSDALATVAPLGDRRAEAILESNLGLLDIEYTSFDRATERFSRSLHTGRTLDDPLVVAQALLNLGAVAKASGDEETARDRYFAALELYERLGDQPYVAATLVHLAMATDDLADARVWATRARDVAAGCGESLRLREANDLLRALEEIEAEQEQPTAG